MRVMKKRTITVTVTIADLDKAIAESISIDNELLVNPLSIALKRHRKRRENIVVIPLAASINGKGYSHQSPIVDQFEMGLHADIYDMLPCKVTFTPILSDWGSVTA
jgi:hypothetical protein